jgi:hypothetical protein
MRSAVRALGVTGDRRLCHLRRPDPTYLVRRLRLLRVRRRGPGRGCQVIEFADALLDELDSVRERTRRAYWDALEADTGEGGMTIAEHERLAQRQGMKAALALVFRPDPHFYLSTGCLHDTEEGHAFCRVEARRYDGTTKTAATCKFCGARCVCPCHRGAP